MEFNVTHTGGKKSGMFFLCDQAQGLQLWAVPVGSSAFQDYFHTSPSQEVEQQQLNTDIPSCFPSCHPLLKPLRSWRIWENESEKPYQYDCLGWT